MTYSTKKTHTDYNIYICFYCKKNKSDKSCKIKYWSNSESWDLFTPCCKNCYKNYKEKQKKAANVWVGFFLLSAILTHWYLWWLNNIWIYIIFHLFIWRAWFSLGKKIFWLNEFNLITRSYWPFLAEKNRQEQILEQKRQEAIAKKKTQENIMECKKLISQTNKKIEENIVWCYINHSKKEALMKEAMSIYDQTKWFHQYFKNEYRTFFLLCENDEFAITHNKMFIAQEKAKYRQYFIDIDEKWNWLTEKQLESAFCGEDATLVNAWAGTGKTKTIESKILYLHDIKKVPLKDILVITYSKASQIDMLNRISNSLSKVGLNYSDDDFKETISTFHAFGKRIVDEYHSLGNKSSEDKLIWKWKEWKSVISEKEKDEVLKLVLDRLKKVSLMQSILWEYLLYYSTPELVVSDFKNINEYYENTKRSYQTLMKNEYWYNITVKSFWELIIANYCIINWIKIEYEPKNHYYTTDNWGKKQYRPDFYLPDYNIYIEYFWVDKDWKTAPFIANDKYVLRMNQKITNHEKSWNQLIDLRYADLQKWKDFLLNKLRINLEKFNIKTSNKIEDHILKTKKLHWSFEWLSKTLKTFLVLFKESWYTVDDLKKKCISFDPINSIRNTLFMKIFEPYLSWYNDLLNEWWYIDFWDMIIEAEKIITEKKLIKKFKYILVDEFQDISAARANLIKSLIEDTKITCVWDDRQSIYKFAGSNTNIFLKFSEYFWYTKEIVLDKTFRFNQWISDISWKFIMMNPDQTIKKLSANNKESNAKVMILENTESKEYDTYNYIIHELVKEKTKNHKEWHSVHIDILYLTRYSLNKYQRSYMSSFISFLSDKFGLKTNSDNWYYNTVLKYTYTENKTIDIDLSVKSLTIHKSKWLEADYVILDYVNQNDRYNFPSSFEDDPILGLVTEDEKKWYPYSEERRLFYVWMTRWKNKAFLLYNRKKESLFLRDLLWLHSNTLKLIQQNEEDMTLFSTTTSEKCNTCGWNLLLSQFEWVAKEYYCNNFRRWCEAKYYQIDGNLRKAPYCNTLNCQLQMKLRKNSRTGELFWWCSWYPDCKSTNNF